MGQRWKRSWLLRKGNMIGVPMKELVYVLAISMPAFWLRYCIIALQYIIIEGN